MRKPIQFGEEEVVFIVEYFQKNPKKKMKIVEAFEKTFGKFYSYRTFAKQFNKVKKIAKYNFEIRTKKKVDQNNYIKRKAKTKNSMSSKTRDQNVKIKYFNISKRTKHKQKLIKYKRLSTINRQRLQKNMKLSNGYVNTVLIRLSKE